MPSPLDSLARLMALWLRVVLARPKTMLALSLLLVVVSITGTVGGLRFVADLNAVVGEGHDFNTIYEEYTREFGQNAPLLVVVDDGYEPRSQAFARELVQACRRSGDFVSAVPVMPSPDVWWFAGQYSATLMPAALERLEPLRNALTRPPDVIADRDALQAIPGAVRTPQQREELAQLEAMIGAVPAGKELPRPLLWSDLVDELATDVASGQPPRVLRAGAWPALLEDAREPPHFAPGESALPPGTATPARRPLHDPLPRHEGWSVARFWAWVAGNPALAQTAHRVALVVVTPWPAQPIEGFPAAPPDAPTSTAAAIERFRELVADVRLRYPDVRAGVTGRPLLRLQEQEAQLRSSEVAGVLSFGLVLLVVVVFVRRTLMAVAIGSSLVAAIAWTMGLVTLTIGELNVLSSAFAVVLCATGVDFGIHFGVAYEHQRGTGRDKAGAIRAGYASVGRGVVAAALTTAVAFAATLVADFRAIEQLGAIASMGMLLCLLAMYTVLPAMLLVFEPDEPRRRPASREEPVLAATRLRPGTARMVLLLAVVVCAAALVPGLEVGFNPERLQMQDPSAQAMPWVRQIEQHSDRSSRFGVVLCDSEAEARQRVQQFEERPDIVKDAEYIGDLLPEHADVRRTALQTFFADSPPVAIDRDRVFRPDRALDRMRQLPRAGSPDGATIRLLGPDGEPLPAPVLDERRRNTERLLQRLEASVGADRLGDSLKRLLATVSAARFRLGGRQLEPGERREVGHSLDRLQQMASSWLELLSAGPEDADTVQRLVWLRTANLAGRAWESLLRGELASLRGYSDHIPGSIDDLPVDVRRRWVSPSGSWLVQIHARKDVWREDARREFVSWCERVDAGFTGPPAQYQRGLDLLRNGFVNSGLLALCAVFVLLAIDLLPVRLAAWPPLMLLATVGLLVQVAGVSFYNALVPALVLTVIVFSRLMREALVAMLPLAVAVCMTLGTMRLAGISFNPANIIILPALLGIGIDIGIHLVHAGRATGGQVRILIPGRVSRVLARWKATIGIGVAPEPAPVLTPVAAAVLVTSITTVIGFGSLVLAGHSGLRSLGMLVAIAIFWATLGAFCLLPAITRLAPLDRRRADRPRHRR